ncbi:hypothetical protein FACS189452_10700 [Bacteroidia bacterium]|nr:hypothetical protein FACS189452_10700 [Bacteroidia bacterium]
MRVALFKKLCSLGTFIGIVKNGTILTTEYENVQKMNEDLTHFLVYYNLYRRHGSLRKELNVKTPFDALNKWFALQPSIFHSPPEQVEAHLLFLQNTHLKINF